MKYNWQLSDWPNFIFDENVADVFVSDFALLIGESKGVVENLTKDADLESQLNLMISEALKTSEIEGEFFSRQDVMSSIKKQLGISDKIEKIRNKNAQAVSKLMIDVRNSADKKLTEALINNWHYILLEFSTDISFGEYRKGEEPMQIISGAIGKEIVHFEAPPSKIVPSEMKNFVKWYQDFKIDPNEISKILIKTSICHLYFESIHPFEDGNGRIGRALAEKCISESLQNHNFIGLSTVIEKDKKKYYNQLKKAQKSLNINEWIIYFSGIIIEAQKYAIFTIKNILHKSKFLDENKSEMNERQLKVILKMFDFGGRDFVGGMTSQKYISITKTSRATATRDLQDLATKNIFKQTGEGRSVKYILNL